MEADIANAVTRFQREQQGRGPQEVAAHIVGDLIIVRCEGIFTPTEAKLTASPEGRKLIASSRRELRSINHQEMEDIVSTLCGSAVLRSYCEVDVDAGEQMEVYVVAEKLKLL